MSVSYWTQTSRVPSPSPVSDMPTHVDVCVVGAGVVGLTTALELAQQGRNVVVVDADQIGRGVTGQSTAKVTVGTGLRLDQIADRHGVDVAREYVDAGNAGMQWIANHLDGPEAHGRGVCRPRPVRHDGRRRPQPRAPRRPRRRASA